MEEEEDDPLQAKKSKLDEGLEKDEGESKDGLPAPRHRVTSKGKDVPEAAQTFEALADRYNVPSLLLQNLEKSGYYTPTGIQAHGIPIMLEVRRDSFLPIIGSLRYFSRVLDSRSCSHFSHWHRQNSFLPHSHNVSAWYPSVERAFYCCSRCPCCRPRADT